MGVRDHMPAARLVRVLFAIFCLLACFEMGCASDPQPHSRKGPP